MEWWNYLLFGILMASFIADIYVGISKKRLIKSVAKEILRELRKSLEKEE